MWGSGVHVLQGQFSNNPDPPAISIPPGQNGGHGVQATRMQSLYSLKANS